MTTRPRPLSARLRLVLVAVLTAMAALLSPALHASASGLPAAQTRVGAIGPTVTTVVGVAEHIAAGQRRSRAPSQLRLVSGHCVAAEGLEGAATTVGSGNAYSVAYETRLSASSYPGVSRGAHFQEANTNLLSAMDSDAAFSQSMEDLIPSLRDQLVGPRSISRGPPTDWTWHHATEPGVMQLVPRIQHTAPGDLQQLFHPGGFGGYSIWGTP